jgi:hypothetical protein
LKVVFLSENFNIVKELYDSRGIAIACRVLPSWKKVHLHDGVESDGIDNLTRPIGKDSVHPELKGKVCI